MITDERIDAYDANFEDLNIGDSVVIIHNEDDELNAWYESNGSGILEIVEIDADSELIYASECPYSINMACVLLV